MDQLPALTIALPLLAAPVCLLLPHRLSWLLATVMAWAVLACSAGLLAQTLEAGVIRYAMGGWAPPWGIEYRVDALNGLVLVMLGLIAAVTLPFAGRSVASEIAAQRIPAFYCLFMLCLAGLLGIVATGDVFNLFVFLEISSLSSYALIALGSDRRALTAAYQYLIMGTIGATFFLIGVGLLYAMTGTLNMADLAQRLPALERTRTVLTGLAFMVAGIGLKAAVFPVHLWLPNAYTYAPSAFSAFIAATATKVAVYVLIRLLATVYGIEFSLHELALQPILLAVALIGVFVASVMATTQMDVKRVLAYSSVAQIGYMIVGLAIATVAGLTASATHVFNHALMKGGLFLAVGAVAYRIGSTDLHAMRGIATYMPWTMAAFVVCGLSLIGVPATAGFISKWYLITAALELGWWWLAAAVLVSSLIAVVYVWRVVEASYFHVPDRVPQRPIREAPLGLLLPAWTLAVANVYFGLDTRLTVDVAAAAARSLLMEASP